MKKFVFIFIGLVFLGSCTPLDTSLDGKILTDKCGNVYKLEWQAGWGATWAFKYPIEKIEGCDTIVVWEYYR